MKIEKRLLSNNNIICGLILVVYSLISCFDGLGNYFRFPLTFLFGILGELFIPLMFIIGIALLINIKVKIKFIKKYLLFIISFIFILALITSITSLIDIYYYTPISSNIKETIDLYVITQINKSVFSINNLNGGIIGHTLFYGLFKIINNTVILLILFSILIIVPFIFVFIIFKEKKVVLIKNQEIKKPIINNIEEVKPVIIDDSDRFKRNINIFDDDNLINRNINDDNIAPSFTKKENEDSTVHISNVKISEDTFDDNKINDISEKESYESIISNNFENDIDDYDDENLSSGIISSSSYVLPSVDLLNDTDNSDIEAKNYEVAREKAEILSNKFSELGLDAKINDFVVGPSITRFEISLAPGVRVNSFLNLQEDFKLALAVNSIRILNPISETIPALGLEIPNVYRSIVTLKSVFNSLPDKKDKLYIPLGKDVSGDSINVALTKMPHAIISGATNSGKSVCLYTLVASLIMQYKPNELKMLLVDPKHVDLAFYDNLPFLLCPVIDEFSKAYVALLKIEKILRNRFDKFKEAGARDFENYNEKMEEIGYDKMPFYLIVIDEFADLVDDDKFGNLIVNQIDKIVRIGRAAGVHVILATQRADTSVINGTIKNNFPARFTFRLSSFSDSKTVLDGSGAEKLLNNGDMLLLTPDYSGLRRLQGAFISDEEIYKITDYIKDQMPANFDPRFLDLRTEEEKLEEYKQVQSLNSLNKNDDNDVIDEEKYKEIKRFVVLNQIASVTNFRVKFGLSYIQAAKMMDRLEQDGIVGSKSSSKGREVLINNLNDIEN